MLTHCVPLFLVLRLSQIIILILLLAQDLETLNFEMIGDFSYHLSFINIQFNYIVIRKHDLRNLLKYSL